MLKTLGLHDYSTLDVLKCAEVLRDCPSGEPEYWQQHCHERKCLHND